MRRQIFNPICEKFHKHALHGVFDKLKVSSFYFHANGRQWGLARGSNRLPIMQLPLEDLEYQRHAIAAVVGVLAGQIRNSFDNSNLFDIQANITDLTPALTESERLKIRCAMKHFDAIGIEAKLDYRLYHAPVKDYQPDFKDKLTV
ncbi:MAG: hypothetical protein HY360_21720 [Verrucomicrobia bacterium]|nr:hypothetical protein [Verrucomicrobiota bacterium]